MVGNPTIIDTWMRGHRSRFPLNEEGYMEKTFAFIDTSVLRPNRKKHHRSLPPLPRCSRGASHMACSRISTHLPPSLQLADRHVSLLETHPLDQRGGHRITTGEKREGLLGRGKKSPKPSIHPSINPVAQCWSCSVDLNY